jgi:hypothetical protein
MFYATPSTHKMDETKRLVWFGAIPLEIHLNDPENILSDSPPTIPFYVHIEICGVSA